MGGIQNLYNPTSDLCVGLEDLSVNVVGFGSGEAGSFLHSHLHNTKISTHETVSSRPLTLADGGDYTCTGTYIVDGKTTTGSGNTTVIAS